MGNFKKTSGRHAKSNSYGRSDDRPSKGGFHTGGLHQATCSKCGTSCEVPFKPNGKKPVFCRDCFKKNDVASYGKPSYGRSSYVQSSHGKPSPYKSSYPKKEHDYSAALGEINDKLNKILRALEQE